MGDLFLRREFRYRNKGKVGVELCTPQISTNSPVKKFRPKSSAWGSLKNQNVACILE